MPTVVIWGPPCSGKTTYVRERFLPGDVVVDLDAIAAALAGAPGHAYSDTIHSLALNARAAVLDDAAAWGLAQPELTAWVIDSNAGPAARRRWRALGAEVVKLTTSRAECERRAIDERPVATLDAIARWYAEHG